MRQRQEGLSLSRRCRGMIDASWHGGSNHHTCSAQCVGCEKDTRTGTGMEGMRFAYFRQTSSMQTSASSMERQRACLSYSVVTVHPMRIMPTSHVQADSGGGVSWGLIIHDDVLR